MVEEEEEEEEEGEPAPVASSLVMTIDGLLISLVPKQKTLDEGGRENEKMNGPGPPDGRR